MICLTVTGLVACACIRFVVLGTENPLRIVRVFSFRELVTVLSPMRTPENVFVGQHPIHELGELAAGEHLHFWFRQRSLRIGALNKNTVWRNYTESSDSFLRRYSLLFREIRKLSSFQWFRIQRSPKFFCESFPGVSSAGLYRPKLAYFWGSFNASNRNPRPLIQFELSNRRIEASPRYANLQHSGFSSGFSGIGGLLVGAPNAIREKGINSKSDQTENLDRKRRIVQPVLLCLAGLVALVPGYWRLKFCNSGRDLFFGTVGMLIGLPLSGWGIAIFLGIV